MDVVSELAEFQFLPPVSLELSRGCLQQRVASNAAVEPVVIYDQTGFHPRTGDPHLPARRHLLPLPPYSPELNPVEELWDQGQEAICNQCFTGLNQLEATLTSALRPLWETPARALALMHPWLHSQTNATA